MSLREMIVVAPTKKVEHILMKVSAAFSSTKKRNFLETLLIKPHFDMFIFQ